MSLTTTTVVIGVFYLLSSIVSAIMQLWISFAFNLVIAIAFSSVLIKPYNAGIRKILFIVVLGILCAGLIAFMGIAIYMLAANWQSEWCDNVINDYNFNNQNACEDWL